MLAWFSCLPRFAMARCLSTRSLGHHRCILLTSANPTICARASPVQCCQLQQRLAAVCVAGAVLASSCDLAHMPSHWHWNGLWPWVDRQTSAQAAPVYSFGFGLHQAAALELEDEEDGQVGARERSSLCPLEERVQEQINESFAEKNGQDLSCRDLAGATFMEAQLRGTDLHGSDLRGAMFTKAVLYRANLEEANLSDALIDRAVLNESNLCNAILRGAWLALTDLAGANITGADFTDAIIDKFQVKQLCQRAAGVNSLTGVDTRQSLRCDTMQFYKGSGK